MSDLSDSEAFYADVLGLEVRWRGCTSGGQPALHIGNEDTYLALFEAVEKGVVEPEYGRVGFNHLGLVVDDLDACRARLKTHGVIPQLEAHYEPGRRLYVYDPDGIEVELVQYD